MFTPSFFQRLFSGAFFETIILILIAWILLNLQDVLREFGLSLPPETEQNPRIWGVFTAIGLLLLSSVALQMVRDFVMGLQYWLG